MKILHIAPFNTANVPLTFVRAENALGHYSRLVTMHRHRYGYDEDICLNLPLMDSKIVNFLRRIGGKNVSQPVFEMTPPGKDLPPRWEPKGTGEALFHAVRDALWEPFIRKAFRDYELGSFDVYQLDGGLGFLRSGKFVRELALSGKKILCCYLGSDLRRRGIIPAINAISSGNFTVELDLLAWYPGIVHVPFPFNADNFQEAKPGEAPPFIIGHAPSNRAAKGSGLIISAVEEIKKKLPVSLLLIEGKPHREAIALKGKCHVFIDQLGPLGYGINTLEALAMGIPVCSSLAPGFCDMFPDNPIFEITPDNIADVLALLVRDDRLRAHAAASGKEWVRRIHDARTAVRKIHEYVQQ